MRGKRFTEEQIIRILQEAEGGLAVADVCRKHKLLGVVVLPLEGKVQRHGCIRSEAFEGTGARERGTEEDGGRPGVGIRMLKDVNSRKW